MKKSAFLVLVLVFSLLWIACIIDDGGDSEITGNFWAQNIETERFYRISAQKLAENSRCEVWVEEGSGVTEEQAKSIADEYEKNIYVRMMNTFGYTVDVKLSPSLIKKMETMELAHLLTTGKTSDAKLTILLLDIKDGYKTTNDPYVGGYFFRADFYSNEALKKAGLANIKSNEREMIYIDTYPSDPASQTSYETLAHEMQHLMNFVSSNIRGTIMDTWIDEGLSGAAQWVYSGQISKERVSWYNNNGYKNGPKGLIDKGNNFFMWDNHDNNPLANLDDYATVYLFFQYLRLQAANPGKIYFDIITSEYPDYRAVTNAENINSSHKDKWSLLLRDWHAANYINSGNGLYGYKNDPVLKDVTPPMVPSGTNSLPLYPGEGVYSKTSTAESVPKASGNINYAGLGKGSDPSESIGFVNGARLTYNIDTNLKGSSATGTTTGIAANTGISITDSRGSLQIGLDNFSFPFQVDAGYFNRRNGSMPDNQINYVFNTNKNNSRSIDKNNGMIKFDISTLERVYINE